MGSTSGPLTGDATEDAASGQFRRFYLGHVDVICRYVANRRRGAADLSDIVAEVFAVAWRRRADLPDGQGPQQAWLLGVARRVVADHVRSDRRRRRLLAKLEAEPPMLSGDAELDERLETAMARLRPQDEELLRLLAWDELPRTDTAAALGCSVNALNIRVHRALRRLARELGASPAGPSTMGGES